MRKLLTLVVLLSLFTLLSSHEFWLSPDKFIYQRGAKINVRFLVGENFEGINWSGNNSKIQTLKLYYGGVSDDLSEYVSEEAGDSIELNMLDEGTPMIAFNSTNSYIEIEPQIFNNYLREDGLQNAIEYRLQNNEQGNAGREYYQRCAKTLFQVGKVYDNNYRIATLMPVDIIVSNNPYTLKNKDSIRVQILYQQEPYAGALVKVWHRENDSTIMKDYIADEKGQLIFPVITSGKWMVSTVKMIRLENDPKAQWQSYWGNLTWGYE